MKSHLKLFPILLSIVFAVSSFFQCSITVHAEIVGDTLKEKLQDFNEKFATAMAFIASSGFAIADGNFKNFLEGYEAFNALDIDGPHGIFSSIDDETKTVTYSDEFVSVMKQALIEYAEETNGFEICSTIDYRTVSPTTFKSSYAYDSFLNLVRESGVIAMREPCNNYFYACRPFHSSRPISLVKEYEYIDSISCYFYDTETWTNYYFPGSSFNVQYTDENGYSSFKTFKSFDEGTPISGSGGLARVIYAGIFKTYVSVDVSNVLERFSFNIYSVDGRKMKVFNSVNALKNYTTGNRSVYFGSGFYDDPGEIKVSFDDLEKYIDGKYDKFFDDLKDLIGNDEDSLTEEDLEKLVDKILDKMDDTGGGSGTGGDNSSILSEILSTLSGYFDSVLAYLDSILTSLLSQVFFPYFSRNF